MKITNNDREVLNDLIDAYADARNSLNQKHDDILKLSEEIKKDTDQLNKLRLIEKDFVTSVAKRENISEDAVINEIMNTVKQKK